jgi:hypothetical protein
MKIKKVINYPGGNTRQPDGSRLPDGYNVQGQCTIEAVPWTNEY